MSGGHWGYMGLKLEEHGQASREVWRLMEALEHELDWGICGDGCSKCAQLRAGSALEAFFDAGCTDASMAISIARDTDQFLCRDCFENARQRGKPGYRLAPAADTR